MDKKVKIAKHIEETADKIEPGANAMKDRAEAATKISVEYGKEKKKERLEVGHE